MAWGADHCFDPDLVPGVVFCNKPIRQKNPGITDLAPTILGEYGLTKGPDMEGKNILED